MAALDKGNRFARADRITDPLEDPGNGARCPGSEHRFGVRRCLDCGAGEDDAGDATGCRLCKANPRGLDTVLGDHDGVGWKIGRAHSELQSLMRISYAVFCLKKKKGHYETSFSLKANRNCCTSISSPGIP